MLWWKLLDKWSRKDGLGLGMEGIDWGSALWARSAGCIMVLLALLLRTAQRPGCLAHCEWMKPLACKCVLWALDPFLGGCCHKCGRPPCSCPARAGFLVGTVVAGWSTQLWGVRSGPAMGQCSGWSLFYPDVTWVICACCLILQGDLFWR